MKSTLQVMRAVAALLTVLLTTSAVNATVYYTSSNSAPETLTNWWTNTNGTGSHPANFTTAGDVFNIQTGDVMTQAATWTVTGTVDINSGGTLARTVAMTFGALVINGTMSNANANSVTVNGNVSGSGTLSSGTTARVFSVTGDWTFGGTVTSANNISLTMNGTGNQALSGSFTGATGTAGVLIINKTSGTVTLGSAITINSGTFTLTDGTFDASTFLLTATTPTFTAGTMRVGATTWAGNYSFAVTQPAGGTIEYYRAGAQTVNAVTYAGILILSGSGAKTISGTTVNGTLSIQGTATTTGTSPTYGGSAILEYMGSGVQTTSTVELPSTVNVDLVIDNSNGVTLDASKTTFSGTLTLTAGSVFGLSTFNFLTPTSISMECGAVTGSSITGSGSLTLGGDVTVTDATTGVGGATISCPIALGATRTFTVADDGTTATDLTISSVMSGATFGVTKAGAGTMALTGSNTYTGAVTISAGILSANTLANASSNSSLGTGGGTPAISIAGTGTLQYTGSGHSSSRAITLTGSGSTIDASGSGTMTLSGAVTGNTFDLVLTGTGTGVESGVIGITTGTVTKNSTGTWTLSGTNTYTGATNVSAGVLNIQNAQGTGTTAGGVTVSSGAALELQGTITVGAETLSLNNDGVSSAGALRNISGNNTWGGTITLVTNAVRINSDAGTLTLNAANSITATAINLTVGGSGNTAISGTITTTSGTLTKDGSGTVTLSGTNTYTGATSVSAGVLNIQNAQGTGTTAGGVTVSSGAALELQGTITVGAETLSLNNTGVGAAGALRNISGNNTWGGTITLVTNAVRINSDAGTLTLNAANSITATAINLTVGGSGSTAISGTITTTSGTLTKDGSGTVTLSGTNTYTGATSVSAGVLNIQNAQGTGTTAGGVTVSSGAALELQGTITVGAETLSLNNTGVGAAGALRNISGNNTWGGTITLVTNAVRINSDAGTLTLNAANSITATAINLTVGGSGSTAISGTITTTSGTLTKDGSGTVTLSGTNTYTGATSVSAGVLNIQNAQGTGTTAGGVTVSSGAALELQGTITVGAETLSLNNTGVGAAGALRNISGNNTWGGTITLVTNAVRINSDAGTLTLNAANSITATAINLTVGGSGNTAISGTITTTSGTLTKDGSGTVTLSGTNTYTGATSVSAGVLNIQNAQGTGTTAGGVTVSSGAALELQGTITVGAETLSLNNDGVSSGGALRNISGTNSWAGAITLSTNPVRINSDAGTLTLTGGIAGAGIALTIGGAGNTTFGTAAIATTTGTLTKDGAGTLTMNFANTYTGTTTINAGTLTYGVNSAISSGAVTVDGGTAVMSLLTFTETVGIVTVDNGGSITSSTGVLTSTGTFEMKSGSVSAILSGSGIVLNKTTSGTVTLSGVNTYTGGTNLSLGILNINNANALGTVAGTFTITGGTIDNTTGGNITTLNYPLALNGDFTYSGSIPRDLNLGTGTATISADRQITVSAGTLTIGGTISAVTRSLTKAGAGTLSFGANAVTLNALTISAGTLVSTSGTINLAGNFTNNSGTSAFTHNSGIVNLNGSSAQTIGGSQSTSFGALTINNAAGVSISVNTTVTGLLTLTDGIISVGANIFTVSATGTLSGSSNSSFVDGPMAKAGTAAFTFPVGKSGAGIRTITISAPTVSSTFTAEFLRTDPHSVGTALGAGIYWVSGCEYWTLARSGTGNASVTLSWESGSTCNATGYVTDLSTLRVAHWNGSSWADEGNSSTTGNTTAGTITTSAALTSFSPFALGTSSFSSNPLPILFADIKAYEKNRGVQIEWSNMTERDLVNYEVERSANGVNFIAINQQLPRSNNNGKESYSAFDAAPFSGANFYRIKVLEISGKVIYSKVMKVDIGKTAQSFTLYPNPVAGGQVSISLSAAQGQYSVKVVNTSGQVMYSQKLNHQGGSMTQTIELPSTINPGVYNMMISGNNYRVAKIFLVQ